ncbi:hypothetical protein CBR_g12230 [Chara braunii]|nr:hypothetical protein CBR_g12230 [Chara braunii]|eukprot:GBG72657.1 hypothetical protein CBR_g12230 [Chara braunii]
MEEKLLHGLLEITIYEAQGLEDADRDGFVGGVFVVYVRPVTEPKEEDSFMDPAIAKLLEEFKDLTEPPTGVVPWPIQRRIEIEPGSRTPTGAVYRMSPRELEELRKQLDELLEKGWIRPSSSPFGAPVLFVPKREGELRICIDYRGLNAITVKNVEPLPRIDDLLDRVQACKYFSKSGYHQIEVHPDDQYKTAFRTRYGHYQFIVMPFGLTNVPATFQRCMDDLFRPWLDRFVVVYLDDILVFNRTLQEHQGHLRQVLEKLREANFKINAKKCEWAKTQVLYLGHVLDGDGIKPEDSKIVAIRDWPTPRTLTELRSFLGLANYYRKFVRNFSTIAAPLRRLLKKEAIWQWDRDCMSALKKLKRALMEYPVLKVADPSLPFVVTTDACRYGIGAVLQQDDDNGYRPVEFMSARMPSEKVATSTYERELYALRQALEHWKHYLLRRHFKVYSDHETLRWLKTQAKMTPKLTRWAVEIDQYDFELKPVKGKYYVVADALSRRSDYFGAIVHYLDMRSDLQEKVRQAYAQDPIYSNLLKRVKEALETGPDCRTNVVDRLCVPNSEEIRSLILGECHDTEGHFDYLGALIFEFGLSENVTRSLGEAYKEDPITMDIINKLEAKDKATTDEFEMVDGLLFLEKAGLKRGRGRVGGRKGKWSNCGRYWMNTNQGGQSSQFSDMSGAPFQGPGGQNVAPPGVVYQAPGVLNQAPPGNASQHFHEPSNCGPVPMMSAMAGPTMMPYPPYQPAGWGFQNWPARGQWQVPNLPAFNQQPAVNQQPAQGQGADRPPNDRQLAAGKGRAANAFPGPGNRAYFTKEYMDILEGIKMDKALDEAKKKVAGGRRSGIRIVDLTEEPRREVVQTVDKTNEMRAWITSTLGQSLILISDKLEDVDKRTKLAQDEKAELERLRDEKEKLEKELEMECSSNEKRKRDGERTPAEASPRVNRVKSRRRGSAKVKARARRIEISEDEGAAEGLCDVKQNLDAKLEKKSELSDIKKLLMALVHEVGDQKGKGPAQESPKPVPQTEDEDEDLVQNGQSEEAEAEEDDEGGLAAYMKMRVEFYNSLHYTRVQEMCKQKGVQYYRKDLGAWELARIDLQDYVDLINTDKPSKIGESSRMHGEDLLMILKLLTKRGVKGPVPVRNNQGGRWLKAWRLVSVLFGYSKIEKDGVKWLLKDAKCVIEEGGDWYDELKLTRIAKWDMNGELLHAYIITKDKDKRKKRPIVPSYGSPFRAASGILSTSLNFLIKKTRVPHFNLQSIENLKKKVLRSLGEMSRFITGKRYIDDLFIGALFSRQDPDGERIAEECLDKVAECYPPGLKLERTDPGLGVLDFLETRIVISEAPAAILMSHKFKNAAAIWEEQPLPFRTYKDFASHGPKAAKFATIANTIQHITLMNMLGVCQKSDAYATVELPPKAIVARTRIIKNSLNPAWNEKFWIEVAHQTTEVRIHVKDNNQVGTTKLGAARIPVETLLTEEETEDWFPLYKEDEQTGGTIRLKIRFISIDTLKNCYGRFGQMHKQTGVPYTYFPERSGHRVTLYQDAHVLNSFVPHIELEDYATYQQHRLWEDVYKTIVEAKHFIYICGWSVYYKVQLVRDEERMIPGAEGLTLGDLLVRKAEEGVKVLLLIWDDRTSGVLGSAGLMATHDEATAEFFKDTAVNCVLCPRNPDEDLSHVESVQIGLMFSHHQKLMVADAPLEPEGSGEQRTVVSYVGGIDLCDGRFDTPDHPLFRTLDTWHKEDMHQPNFEPPASIDQGGPRQPWHDIHAKVEGPVAWDILHNFEQRWRSQMSDEIHELYSLDENQHLFQAAYSPLLPLDDPEAWNVQFFRSIDSGSVHGFPDDPAVAGEHGLVSGKNVTVERSIQDAYIHSIRRAEQFIYIENQYFLGSCFAWEEDQTVGAIHTVPIELALKIVRKIDDNEPFAVYIILPMWPEGVPTDGPQQEILKWQHHTMQMMYKMIAEAIARNRLGAKPTDYLNFYCLANREAPVDEEYCPPNPVSEDGHYKNSQENRRFMIYVHSKMMIVDDEFIIVGSANINQRSMDGGRDTESAIGAYQPYHTYAYRDELPRGQVHGFRMSLWAEHTGGIEDIFLEPSSILCVERMNEIAHQNWEEYLAEDPQDLEGHIIPYPVVVAEDGTVEALPDMANFPDSAASILGEKMSLLDILTT